MITTTPDAIVLFVLGFLATVPMVTMFITRERMLAWPSAIFWVIFGGYCYRLFTTPWVDITYYLFIAGSLGMTTFCILAQFALREINNKGTDKDEYIDESKENDPDSTTFLDEDETLDDDGIIKDEYIDRPRRAPARVTKKSR